jgi:hypothetical protein
MGSPVSPNSTFKMDCNFPSGKSRTEGLERIISTALLSFQTISTGELLSLDEHPTRRKKRNRYLTWNLFIQKKGYLKIEVA